MNVQHRPTEMTESCERHSSAHRPRRWLIIARVGWGVLTVFTLIVVVASLPVYVAHLQKLCAGTATACAFSQQLSTAQARMLTGMGLSLGDYAAFTVALTLATVVVQETMQPAFLSLWVFPVKQQAAEGRAKSREQ